LASPRDQQEDAELSSGASPLERLVNLRVNRACRNESPRVVSRGHEIRIDWVCVEDPPETIKRRLVRAGRAAPRSLRSA
jgi:hypothetical protein